MNVSLKLRRLDCFPLHMDMLYYMIYVFICYIMICWYFSSQLSSWCWTVDCNEGMHFQNGRFRCLPWPLKSLMCCLFIMISCFTKVSSLVYKHIQRTVDEVYLPFCRSQDIQCLKDSFLKYNVYIRMVWTQCLNIIWVFGGHPWLIRWAPRLAPFLSEVDRQVNYFTSARHPIWVDHGGSLERICPSK
jgi:hypothetical protein